MSNKVEKDEITALVPVRSGSRRIKHKNIRPFGSSNLLIRKVKQLKESVADNVIVSSDSKKYLKMAKKEGAYIHNREKKYADDKSVPFGEVVRKICSEIEGDIVIWAPCVCPFIDEQNYNEATNIFLDKRKEGFDSLVSVKVFKDYVWDDNGPLNYEIGEGHVISQKLPEWYIVTNGIYMAERQKMVEWSYFIGDKPIKYIVDKKEAIDIDDMDDLKAARAWLNV